MPQDLERAAYARELMTSLRIPVVELGDLLGIQPTRVSEFRNGRPQSAVLQNRICDAVYRISKIWHDLGFPCPLSELDTAEERIANLRRLTAFAKSTELQAELDRRTAAT